MLPLGDVPRSCFAAQITMTWGVRLKNYHLELKAHVTICMYICGTFHSSQRLKSYAPAKLAENNSSLQQNRTDLYLFIPDLWHDRLLEWKIVHYESCSQLKELSNGIQCTKIRPPEVFPVLGFISCNCTASCFAALTFRYSKCNWERLGAPNPLL